MLSGREAVIHRCDGTANVRLSERPVQRTIYDGPKNVIDGTVSRYDFNAVCYETSRPYSEKLMDFGDCGSVLVTHAILDGVNHPVIVGMHCAQRNAINALELNKAVFITREMLDGAMKRLNLLDSCQAHWVHLAPCDSIQSDPDVRQLHNPLAYFKPEQGIRCQYLGVLARNGTKLVTRSQHSSVVDTRFRSFWEERGFLTDCTQPPLGMWQSQFIALQKFSPVIRSFPTQLS